MEFWVANDFPTTWTTWACRRKSWAHIARRGNQTILKHFTHDFITLMYVKHTWSCDTHVHFSCINHTHVTVHMFTCTTHSHGHIWFTFVFTHMYGSNTCNTLLHLHMSTQSFMYVSIHMLTKIQIYLLQIRDDPDNPQRVTNAAEIDAWILRDVTSRNYIFATLTRPMKESLYSCETAAIMWTRLDTQYRLRAAENLHLLWQSFYDFTYQPGILKIVIHHLTYH